MAREHFLRQRSAPMSKRNGAQRYMSEFLQDKVQRQHVDERERNWISYASM